MTTNSSEMNIAYAHRKNALVAELMAALTVLVAVALLVLSGCASSGGGKLYSPGFNAEQTYTADDVIFEQKSFTFPYGTTPGYLSVEAAPELTEFLEVGTDVDPGEYVMGYVSGDNPAATLERTENGSPVRYNVPLLSTPSFVDLKAGDKIWASGIKFTPIEKVTPKPFSAEQRYDGWYKAGYDIPAGTYTLTERAKAEGDTEGAARYILSKGAPYMSTTEEVAYTELPAGESATVTLEEGDYLYTYHIQVAGK